MFKVTEENLNTFIGLAGHNVAHAQFKLGEYYEQKANEDTVDAPDMWEQAISWYKKAAENGHAKAQFAMSCLYCEGLGVEEDHKKGFEYALKAAEQGLAEAQIACGHYYFHGEGVEEDIQKAIHWYTKAMEQDWDIWRKVYNDEDAAAFYVKVIEWQGRALEKYLSGSEDT